MSAQREPDGSPPAPAGGDHPSPVATGNVGPARPALTPAIETSSSQRRLRPASRGTRRPPSARRGGPRRRPRRTSASPRPRHQTARRRRVVTERDTVAAHAARPCPVMEIHTCGPPLRPRLRAPSIPNWPVRGAGWPRSRRRPVGPARRDRVPSLLRRSRATESLAPVQAGRRTRPRHGGAPSGLTVDSTFDHRGPAPASRSHTEWTGPQGGEVDDEQAPSPPWAATRRDAPRTTAVASAASPSRSPGIRATAARSTRAARIPRAHGLRDRGPGARGRSEARHRARATPARAPCRRPGAAKRPATPSPPGKSRQLPPQLVPPRRHNPMHAARSPSRLSASSPGKTAPGARRPRPGARAVPSGRPGARSAPSRHWPPNAPPGDRPRRHGNVHLILDLLGADALLAELRSHIGPERSGAVMVALTEGMPAPAGYRTSGGRACPFVVVGVRPAVRSIPRGSGFATWSWRRVTRSSAP